MPEDLIRLLLEQQLAAWADDPQIAAGQLYLISRAHSLDVEVNKTGEPPALSKDDLKELLARAASEDVRPGFEVNVAGYRGHAYPLKQDTMLQGVWVLFPSSTQVDWADWTRGSLRFSQQLFTLRQAGLGNPPTFRQLVETFPDPEPAQNGTDAPPLHWERSQSRVVMAMEDDLSSGLLVDHLPLF